MCGDAARQRSASHSGATRAFRGCSASPSTSPREMVEALGGKSPQIDRHQGLDGAVDGSSGTNDRLRPQHMLQDASRACR